jgi:hypothetical protein
MREERESEEMEYILRVMDKKIDDDDDDGFDSRNMRI